MHIPNDREYLDYHRVLCGLPRLGTPGPTIRARREAAGRMSVDNTEWQEAKGHQYCPMFRREPDADSLLTVYVYNCAKEWAWTADTFQGVSISGNMLCKTREQAQEAAEAALAHWRDSQRMREWLTVFSTMTPERFKPEYALDALNGGWVDV